MYTKVIIMMIMTKYIQSVCPSDIFVSVSCRKSCLFILLFITRPRFITTTTPLVYGCDRPSPCILCNPYKGDEIKIGVQKKTKVYFSFVLKFKLFLGTTFFTKKTRLT